MKLFSAIKVVLFSAALLVISACSASILKLDPSTSGLSKITLGLRAPQLADASGRAIVSGGGYLYLRTFGGPEGNSGPFYGPYTLDGGTYTTTAIPPGSFSDMIIVYSSIRLGQDFTDLMNLPDSRIYGDLKLADIGNPLSSILDGYASVGFTGATVIETGDNSLSATLVPVGGTSSTVVISEGSTGFGGSFSVNSSPSATLRRFIKLDFSAVPGAWITRAFAVASTLADASFALYDDQGKQIPSFVYDAAEGVFAFDTAEKYSTLFLYVDTASAGTLQFFIKDKNPPAKSITSFIFSSLNLTATINEAAKTITATVPYGTDISALVPSITHTGANISPLSGVAQNFMNNVTYAVTAADGSTQSYTVTVTIEAPPAMMVEGPLSYGGGLQTLVSGNTIDFGFLFTINTPKTISFTIMNNGSGPLNLNSVTISGADPTFYPFTMPETPILPGNSVTFTIDFIMPTALTYLTRTAQLIIDSNDPTVPSFTLSLTGFAS